jgi:serine/threonine protein kinase
MLETEGSSMVARVKKKDIKKQFALKIVPRAMKGSQYLKETESKVFQELPQHPFIISRENYFMNDKYHYFLSEFVESKNLDQCLVSRIHERCKFDEQTVRFWAAEMALGIHHLHENSLAFQGNLRPTKVLVDKEGHIHLILPLSPSAPISFEQYSQYLPPEILEGRSDIGKESDWWSFGVLLYLMLAGKSPFAASKINQTVQNVLSEEVKLPDDLSLESKDLLFSLLTKDLTYRMIDYGKIKSHPFFKGIDWERIGRKQLQGPYKPSFNAKVRAPTPVPEINDTIVVSNYNADEFMGYTFAESRERKK